MPSWPVDLPPLVTTAGFLETYPWGNLRTEMDAGPAKVRRRTTAAARPIACQIKCTGDQLTDLENFIHADLADGVLPFTWVHPRTQLAATFRFREPPSWVPSSGGQTWTVTLPLEVLPS